MLTKKATYIEACLLVNSPADDVDGQAYTTVFQALERLGISANMDEFNYCPLSEGNNAVIYNTIGASRFPLLRLFARYADGSVQGFVFSADALDYAKSNISRTTWDAEGKHLDSFIEALYTGDFGNGKESLLCQIVPPLCALSKTMWGALALYGAYKTTQARNTVGRGAWGVGTALAAQAYINIPSVNGGIGKLYDSSYTTLRPNAVIDDYWNDLKIKPSQVIGRDFKAQTRHKDPKAALDHYDLHSIEFGNWMNQEDRARFLFGVTSSMDDMAKVIGISQNEIGHGKELAIALGARGRGGRAAAFYIPLPYHLINMTKPWGPGYFVHEYGHAIDFWAMLKFKLGAFPPSGGAKTNRIYNEDAKGILKHFEEVFKILYWTEDWKPTRFAQLQIDRTEYYQSRVEVWARTFERFMSIEFKKRKIVNRFGLKSGSNFWPPEDLVRKASPHIRKILKMVFS